MPLVFFSFKNNIFEYDKVLVNTAVLAGTLPDESTRINKIVDQSLDVLRVSLQRKIIPHKKLKHIWAQIGQVLLCAHCIFCAQVPTDLLER